MQILKDILIARGQVDRYFDTRVPVDLWRAKKTGENEPLFQIVDRQVLRANGKVRPPDITIDVRGGVPWVSVQERPRGLSVFDRPDMFARGQWEYYRIPAGTEIPAGLAIVDDGPSQAVAARHYTVAPARAMPLAMFRQLLAQLAKMMIREAA